MRAYRHKMIGDETGDKRNMLTSIKQFEGKKVNFHTHTTRCKHATGEDREYVERAIEAGFEVLGFSDHAPYLFEDSFVSRMRMDMEQLGEYVESIYALKKEYEKDIEIYCGLEMEYFPKRFAKTIAEIQKQPIEYLLLAQHYFDDEVGNINVGTPWDDEEHLELYVNRILEGLDTNLFLYVAHPDIIHFTGSDEVYERQMTRLAVEFKKRNMPVEINISGLRYTDRYPNPKFVEIAKRCGNQFIIGQDAHFPDCFLDVENYRRAEMLIKD